MFHEQEQPNNQLTNQQRNITVEHTQEILILNDTKMNEVRWWWKCGTCIP